jgi:hypothetical protein
MTNHTSSFKNIGGQRFGRLVALHPLEKNADRKMMRACQCDCGRTSIAIGKELRTGHTSSCGCLVVKHGYARNGKEHYLYRTWARMRERCNNPAHKFFKYYGALGVQVCKRWDDFAVFLADVISEIGERPPGHTLDRYPDNNGNYEPGNIRWATSAQQAQNRRERPHV